MNFRDWFRIKIDRLKGKKNDLFSLLKFPYENTGALTDVLAGRNYETIGLEVPANYVSLRDSGADFGVFAELADFLVAQGKAVVPLEHVQHVDRDAVLTMLIDAFLPGRDPEKYLTDKVLKYATGRRFSVEEQQSPRYQRRLALYEQARAMLGQIKTHQDLGRQCVVLVNEKQSHIVGRINSSNPDLVILASDTASAVKDKLPQHAYMGQVVWPVKSLVLV